MPYTLERPQPGIALFTWRDTLTEDDFRQSVFDRARLADESGDTRYVAIMNLTGVAVKTINIRMAIWAIEYDKRLHYVLIVSPSLTARSVLNIVARVVRFNYEIVGSVEKAVQRAQTILNSISDSRLPDQK